MNLNKDVMHETKPVRDATATHTKLLGLEILRFAAAVVILVDHYIHFSYIDGAPVGYVTGNVPFPTILLLLNKYGVYGVQLFWCISGFILYFKYQDSISDRTVGGHRFFILRFSRLYPLHVSTLLIVAALQLWYFDLHNYSFVYHKNNLPSFVAQLFMASEWGSGYGTGFSFNGPIWSVSVEVLVYIIFYLVLRYLGKSWLINMLIIACWPLARLLKIGHPLVDCLYYFYAGGLAAIVARSVSPDLRSTLNLLAALFLISLPLVAWRFKLIELKSSFGHLLMAFAPVLVFCASAHIKVSRKTQELIEAAGNMTYSSYLIHFPFQLAVAIVCSLIAVPIPFPCRWFFFFYFMTTLVMSYLIFRYFESPAQISIRNRFLRTSTVRGVSPLLKNSA